MKLDLFATLKDVKEESLHPKFKILRDNAILEGERNVILNWTDGFIDRDNKIVKEFQTTFHSSFWEFYLYRVFTEAGFTVDFTRDRPDFMITAPVEVNIEAVVSNIKKDGTNEDQRTLDDILSMIDPPYMQNNFDEFIVESIVRNSNAILGKNAKYLKGYKECTWVKAETPFVIALSSYDQINYGREYYYSLIALLYGLKYDPAKNNFDVIEEVIKPGTDSPIPVGLFNSAEFEHISGIMFSCTLTMGKLTSLAISQGIAPIELNSVINIRNDYEPPFFKVQVVSKDNPEELSDGLFMFHNPFAKFKLPEDVFKATNVFQVKFEERKLTFEGENLPIVSRLNTIKTPLLNIAIGDIHRKFNR